RSHDLALRFPRERAEDEQPGWVLLERQGDFLARGPALPLADQEGKVAEAVHPGAVLAGGGHEPLAVLADVCGRVQGGRREPRPVRRVPQEAFLDGQVAGRETDRPDLDLEFALVLLLERLGEGLLDGLPPPDNLPVRVLAFTLL